MPTDPITEEQFNEFHQKYGGCCICEEPLTWSGAWMTYPPHHSLYCMPCAENIGINSLKGRKFDVAKDAIPAKDGFTFGCDPELFIVDAAGKPVSAAGLIPGTKDEPFKVAKGAVQVDGMAAEFNTDPATTFVEFNDNIVAVMAQLKAMLPTGYGFLIEPAVHFDPDVFDAAPTSAKVLGCNPDFNAWTGQMNSPPYCEDDPYLRTAAGHLHVGWPSATGLPHSLDDPQHLMNCRDLAKQFDWYLGAWSLRIDKDATRRRLYGGAGAMRFKPYGFEYRVLSNFWITAKERRLTVWNRMQQAIIDMRSREQTVCNALSSEQIVEAINTANLPATLEHQHRYPITTITRGSAYII